MATYNKQFRFFIRRPWATFLLAVMIAANYAFSVRLDGSLTPSVDTLVRLGAVTQWTVADGAYWRLLAAGFLHGSPMHLAGNLLCLVAWGSILENRVGAVYFVVIFAVSLVCGSLVSIATHQGAFVGVGASGAISGVFGALMALFILGKLDLSIGFIGINLLLNVALALTMSGVDWQAHLGGFTAGLATCACLDALLKAGRLAFRCKFPEFVKVNTAILLAAGCVSAALARPAFQNAAPLALMIAVAVACALALLKLLDVLLLVKRGLLFVSALFAVLNAVAFVLLAPVMERLWASGCALKSAPAPWLPYLELVQSRVCPMPDATVAVLCAAAFILTGLFYLPFILRGWRDVGFVGAGLVADARRAGGL